MSQSASLHSQAYCYYIELTGTEQPELLNALTASEQVLGDWERVHLSLIHISEPTRP